MLYDDLVLLLTDGVPEEKGVDLARQRLKTAASDPLGGVLADVQQANAKLENLEAFNRFLNLVADGIPPAEAAQRVLHEQR